MTDQSGKSGGGPSPTGETPAEAAGGAAAGARPTVSRRGAVQLAAGVVGVSLAGVVVAVRHRTQSAPAPAVPVPSFEPLLFGLEQALLVDALADDLIPETESPGAVRAGVPAFIDAFVREVYDEPERAAFLAGVDTLSRAARAAHGRPFSACSPDQRAALLVPQRAEAEFLLGSDPPPRSAPFCFIVTFHQLCIEGFCQSKLGATRVLQYEGVPGAYHGCVPLAAVGRAWATS